MRHTQVLGPNCILNELEKWVELCKRVLEAVESDGLFCIRGAPIVTDLDIASAMKKIVVYLGWDDRSYLRIRFVTEAR